MMKTIQVCKTIMLLGITLITSSAVAVDDVKMRFVSSEKQQPAIKAGKVQAVAVLDLVINASEGKAKSVEMRSMKVVNTFAPKVFARSSKAESQGWKVTINGKRTASFMINSPLDDIEIENLDKANSPYSVVRESGPVQWTLVVPLYKDGESLGAETIEIDDMTNKSRLLSVPLTNRK